MPKNFSVLEIHTDGGSRNNPGPAGIGVIAESEGDVVFTLSEYIGINTNNVAEYTAVVRALEEIQDKEIFAEKIHFILDSELIVRQITGIYKIKLPHLQEIYNKIKNIVHSLRAKKQIDKITFSHVLRSQNKKADALVNEALDKQANLEK